MGIYIPTKFYSLVCTVISLINNILIHVRFKESGQEVEKPTREFLATKLGVVDDVKTAKIPLLYYVVYAFMQQENE